MSHRAEAYCFIYHTVMNMRYDIIVCAVSGAVSRSILDKAKLNIEENVWTSVQFGVRSSTERQLRDRNLSK